KIPDYRELTSGSSEGDDNVKSSGQTESEKYQVLDDPETFFNEDYTDDEFNTSPIEADLKKFKETYLTMDPDYMWTLKTGRKVETVIYEFAKSLHRESYLHSFIINDADVETKSLFSPEEWKEIKNLEVIDRPKLDPCHKELLRKYTVNDIKKLRSLLFELFIPDDPAFDNLNIDLIRGEGMSFASSERKNIQRKINDHKKFGRKGDGVFRLHKGRLEFGAIEAGRNWEEINDKLIRECKMKENLVKKLKVIGILHGANRLQVLTIDHPEGYITRINRNNVQEVAGRLTNSKPLALVLKEVLYARSIIIATMDIIDKKDDLKIETFLDDNKK
ncbi:13582_t:CDS:2, partial [Racocetra fulgida]